MLRRNLPEVRAGLYELYLFSCFLILDTTAHLYLLRPVPVVQVRLLIPFRLLRLQSPETPSCNFWSYSRLIESPSPAFNPFLLKTSCFHFLLGSDLRVESSQKIFLS